MLVAGPFGLGLPELVVVFAVVVLIFGVGKLGDVGGAVGRSVREFRKAAKEDDAEDEQLVSASSSEESDPTPSATETHSN